MSPTQEEHLLNKIIMLDFGDQKFDYNLMHLFDYVFSIQYVVTSDEKVRNAYQEHNIEAIFYNSIFDLLDMFETTQILAKKYKYISKSIIIHDMASIDVQNTRFVDLIKTHKKYNMSIIINQISYYQAKFRSQTDLYLSRNM